jgi:hypothetical protein
MAFQFDGPRGPSGRARANLWEFRVLFAGTFLIMLVSTLFSRLMPAHRGADAARGSILHEASARAERIVPFMFMG